MNDLVNQAQTKLKRHQLALSNVGIKAFNVDETVETELKTALEGQKVEMPEIEFMGGPAIRLYKDGQIEFFDPSGIEEVNDAED